VTDTRRQAHPQPSAAPEGQPAPVLAPRPDVVEACLGIRADIASAVRTDRAHADLWAVHAAVGGLLAAELAGAGRLPLAVAWARLVWRCAVVVARWGGPMPPTT
jgi:hypothetical protein